MDEEEDGVVRFLLMNKTNRKVRELNTVHHHHAIAHDSLTFGV
jgi:hypothetical protein